ncbi:MULTISPECIES: 2-aminoethylphosphonate aminotransferase [unclassified Bacillus (in: firmicutes)]|uniref:2-aminoethylphosphonate aminotransferase n=1 Tax=unclassified Bacillus (in: firmicutes) TaxID=185979 RepID=UPI0008EB05D5|nr:MULTISPECIES: 2-aminoethylphosphonate--pyruvate transaminase [unclassified Bacillus (in: firmicutes)]SFA77865.1 2-aminoethylphosphonate-pyruvate transaminase [Bacillus sp. UNCCL13]SFQ67750.1 2-aminoethylphosphonate-pyruvate transaminase [Bacillus sp. cl95]
MIKTAVILAAGMGSRLRERTIHRPKGFLELDELSIIEHSIKKLKACGIQTIFIGTGFKSEYYEALTIKYPEIICVKNASFQSTGSMYTLYLLKERLNEDFLLMESDLIYEKRGIEALVEDARHDIILASDLTYSADEVFIECNRDGSLKNMSKQRGNLDDVHAELVGISKISFSTYKMMCEFAEKHSKKDLDYEQALVGISSKTGLHIKKLCNYAWCEVDDEGHWQRAINVIYPIIKAKENLPKPVPRNVLLNPGPATTTDTVKYAQVVPDICPREKEFGSVMEFIAAELTKFVAPEDEYTTVLFGGSGTAAVESILSSVIGNRKVLIINNGAYGKRMCEIAKAYGIGFYEFESPAANGLEIVQLEKFIDAHQKEISHLAIVHNETTTGLLNPIEQIGEICSNHGIQMIVDAMSSYGAIPINMKRMNIHYLAASSNKNLQGMAGVSFVIAHKASLEKSRYLKPRNLYLNLYSQYEHFQTTGQMRFTPPVQTLYALKQAIIETKFEGIENRYARYSRNWEVLINGISKLGLTHLVDCDHHSKIITAIHEPDCEHYDFEKMHDFLYRRGFTIYPGKFAEKNTFRIANIGEITEKDIEDFLLLLEQYLKNESPMDNR